MSMNIAIDGPAGAGKSTIAKKLAADLGYVYVDTGAMFRTIGLYALRAGKDPKDNEAVNALLSEISLRLDSVDGEQHIYLNGEDVSRLIRTDEVRWSAAACPPKPNRLPISAKTPSMSFSPPLSREGWVPVL